MINSNNNVEILAPCGSYDILIAAIKAGADACYLGGNKFGARAYATNFDESSIIKAIEYAHIHNSKIYLTINTLFKNNEIDLLYDYLYPYYIAGLDAVIIQDIGVFKAVKEMYPHLPIHCSTQMNITSVHAAKFMKELGADRIVTAREMNLNEIKHIKDNVDIEIETFVHGAMCYSYSGQCLMSSLAGGRSGNRGRCAQPCRQCYNNKYLLSMKDLCAIEHIPELVNAGIDSFKIEGRMKNEYYVASAVDAYKDMLIDYYNNDFDIDKARRYKEKLANVFNRGGFADGYFFVHNNTNMISVDRPNNQGVKAGKIKSINQGAITILALTDLYPGDVFEIKLNDNQIIEITSNKTAKANETIVLNAPKTKYIKASQTIYRTKCNKILNDITDNIINSKKYPIKLYGTLTGKIGEKLRLQLDSFINNCKFTSYAEANIVEKSDKSLANIEQIKSKLSQLGNTDYTIESLLIDVDSDAFIPASLLKQLRRDAITKLEQMIIDNFKRDDNSQKTDFNYLTQKITDKTSDNELYCFGVSNYKQLKQILTYSRLQQISMPLEVYNSAKEDGVIDSIKKNNINIYITLPYICNSNFSLLNYLPNDDISGIYIRNIDELANYISIKEKLNHIRPIVKSSMYGYNNISRYILSELSENISIELPKELNINELSDLNNLSSVYTIYEHQQVMLSAQCISKTTGKCHHNKLIEKITDNKGNHFFAQCICDECCNVIYNGLPYCAPKNFKNYLSDITVNQYDINFTVEDEKRINQIMDYYSKSSNAEQFIELIRESDIHITNGHNNRGVD